MASVQYSIPILSLGGRIGNSQIVFYTSRGRALVRAFTQPANPATGDQASVRAFLATSAKHWSQLTDSQRQAWEDYARAYFQQEYNGTLSTLSGAQIYNKVAFYRQALGQSLPGDAPLDGPPSPLSSFTGLSASAADEFVFSVQHGISVLTGKKLLARITPTIPAGRASRATDLRYIAGVGPASFIDLPASGANGTFSNARFVVPDGAKYRVELTVISPSGVPSLAAADTLTHVVA